MLIYGKNIFYFRQKDAFRYPLPQKKSGVSAVKERSEIDDKYKWDLTPLYATDAEWEAEFEACTKEKKEQMVWPSISPRELSSPSEIKILFDAYFAIERMLSKLYTYAHLRNDEDASHELNKQRYERATLLYHKLGQESAWISPTLLMMDESLLRDAALAEYQRYIDKILHNKPFVLSAPQEHLMSLSARAVSSGDQAFYLLNNVDLEFEAAKDSEGKEHPLSHGTLALYLQGTDRELRKNALKNIHEGFGKFENTVTELLHGKVQAHLFETAARRHENCLKSALYPHNIDVSVYTTLIETVRGSLDALHDYMGLRKKVLGYEELHTYDMHMPIVAEAERTYTYEEACEIVIDSVAILGEEYQETLRKGLLEERWVDVYESKSKRSGAYSSGCYDSFPYMLLNFHGTLRDVMTLSHEAGHSMHTYFSQKTQYYHDSRYPIFVAEVASTFNEELTFDYLLKGAQTEEERSYLLNKRVDDVRATLFRQTQFAEFELFIHTLAEQGVPITAQVLKDAYGKMNKTYYGPSLTHDDFIEYEYLRIPHFYANFYVYQYATGISAAHALVENVRNGGDAARDQYLNFLKGGGSKYPLDLLKGAGVDMTSKEPIEKLITHFREITKELESVLVTA